MRLYMVVVEMSDGRGGNNTTVRSIFDTEEAARQEKTKLEAEDKHSNKNTDSYDCSYYYVDWITLNKEFDGCN